MRAAVPLMLAILWVSADLALDGFRPQLSVTARLGLLSELAWGGHNEKQGVEADPALRVTELMGGDRQLVVPPHRLRAIRTHQQIESQTDWADEGVLRAEILVRHQIERFEPGLCPTPLSLPPPADRPARS